MALQDLQVRTTHDVDVLCAFDASTGTVRIVDRIAPEIRRCIERVGRAHPELSSHVGTWVNLGAGQLARWGLPAGLEERLVSVRISDALQLRLLGRRDLVALKLYAATNPQGNRQAVHRSDLRTLEPEPAEIEAGLAWVLALPDPNLELIRSELRVLVKELGHDDIADYL